MVRNVQTCFGRLLNYLDLHTMGEEVTRKELLEAVYGRSTGINRSTVDKWKRQLVVCGYLVETDKPGVYKKGWNIPVSLTTSWLERVYTRELDSWYKTHQPKIDEDV